MAEFTKARLRKALWDSLESGNLEPLGDGFLGWYAKMTHDESNGRFTKYTIVVWHDDHGLAFKNESVYASDETAVERLASDAMHWQRYLLWPEKPSESIKDWYQRLCQTDPEGEYLKDVPFYEYLVTAAKHRSFYVCGVNDSIVRRRLQAALDAVMGCKDNYIYDLDD